MCSLALKDWLDILALIVSCATLTLGYRAYNKLLNQEAGKGQFQEVQNLIKTIINTKIHIEPSEVPNGLLSGELNYSLFEIASSEWQLPHGEPAMPLIMSQTVAEEDFKPIWDFIFNPLTPPSISNNLSKLLIGLTDVIKPEHKENQILILSRRSDILSLQEGVRIFYASGGINELQAKCKDIRESIVKWYEHNGIDNFNRNALILPNLEASKITIKVM